MGLLESTFLLTGSVDLLTLELVMLDAVLLAEAKDHANWAGLAALTELTPEGPARDALRTAVEAVLPQEEEHFGWAADMRSNLIIAQATSRGLQVAGAKAEKLVARIKSWLD